jgi:glycosyltransferase involved in cell wall biosynthesis
VEVLDTINRPLISVIMSAYNVDKFISQSIDSVLNQSYSNFEFIIINDGSSDSTKDIIESFSDNRIKLFHIQNSGTCAALNFGLNKSTGRFIKFLDSDDILNKCHLEAQIECLFNSTKGSVVSCKWIRFYNNDLSNLKEVPESVWQSMSSKQWILKALRQDSDMMPPWLWLIPREIINDSGFFNENLSYNHDFEFSIRLLLKSSYVVFSDKSIVYYRTGNMSSLSNLRNEKAWLSVLESTNIATTLLIEKIDDPDIKRLCAKRYFNLLFELYPKFPSIAYIINNQMVNLGFKKFDIPGSNRLRILGFFMGWKFVKMIKLIQNKICVF